MITDKTAIENYMLIDIDSSFNDQLDEWIAAVQQYMDMETDRQLIADDEEGTYKYDGSGKKKQLIDDFVEISTVDIGEEQVHGEYEDETVFFYPANSTPKWRLEMDNKYFTKGRQNISVVGRRGYADSESVPGDLKLAATIFVAGIINFSNAHEGEVRSEQIGRWTVTYATERQQNDFRMAKDTLKRYRRIR